MADSATRNKKIQTLKIFKPNMSMKTFECSFKLYKTFISYLSFKTLKLFVYILISEWSVGATELHYSTKKGNIF